MSKFLATERKRDLGQVNWLQECVGGQTGWVKQLCCYPHITVNSASLNLSFPVCDMRGMMTESSEGCCECEHITVHAWCTVGAVEHLYVAIKPEAVRAAGAGAGKRTGGCPQGPAMEELRE